MTGWVPDVLPGYWQRTIPLGSDPAGEGDIVATLIRRGEPTGADDHAVLAVHGYTDYFFNTALADHFADRGFAFYALDLQKCGRSRRDGQTPHFITDLAHYDAELELALSAIREQAAAGRPDPPPASSCTATPPAGSSCRCGWTGCVGAIRRRTRASAAWCSTARSWICTARRSCATL